MTRTPAVVADRPLVVSEAFGPTLQGEGPSAGRPAGFVRLGLCNLDCAWCDTPYTWDWQGKVGPPQDRSALVEWGPADWHRAVNHHVPAGGILVVTGGEPLLQAAALGPLVAATVAAGTEVEVETNGTYPPPDWHPAVRYNVSPKMGHAGTTRQALRPEVLAKWAAVPTACFKFVVRGSDDVHTVAGLVREYRLPRARTWVMPEGVTAEAQVARLRTVANAAVAEGLSVSPRLHTLAWDDQRGR